MNEEDVGHISIKTRERALTLAENAKKLGLRSGDIRYNSHDDFMCFWFTNGFKYIIVFCTPLSYLVESHDDGPGEEVIASYSIVKNVRNFLFYLRAQKMIPFEEYLSSIVPEDVNAKDVLRKFMEAQGDADNKDVED